MRWEMRWQHQDGERLPVALWRPGPGYRMISSAVAGGGIGPREWVLNAQVPATYSRTDPAVHVAELAAGEPEDFAGPRSRWGARIARAVHAAVHTGALRYRPAEP